MNAYEVMLDVDGKAITRTEWATTAFDAVGMALINASAAEMGMAKNIRLVHVGPPMMDVVRAQEALMRAVTAATETATKTRRSWPWR